MKNNLFVSFLASFSVHALFFLVPAGIFPVKYIDMDIVLAPSSIEISMVHPVSPVTVRSEDQSMSADLSSEARRAEEALVKTEPETIDRSPESLEVKENIPETEPVVGAITEQISQFMINKPPPYPTIARIRGWEGEVVLIASICEDGTVAAVSILYSSGYNTLDSAARKAISRWKFRNVDRPLRIKITVKFVLTT